MTPIALVKQESPSEIVAYACAVCGLVYTPRSGTDATAEIARVSAEQCCGRWICESCGAEHKRKYCGLCSTCQDRTIEARHFERAKKLRPSDYDGPVYWDNLGEGDGFADDLESLIETVLDDSRELPAYVWACTISYPRLDADHLIDAATQDCSDGIEIENEEGLRVFVAEWNAEQTMQTRHPDYSRAVVLDVLEVKP